MNARHRKAVKQPQTPSGTTYRPYCEADRNELTGMVLSLYREDPTGNRISRKIIDATIAKLTGSGDRGRIHVFGHAGAIAGYGIAVHFWSNEYGGDVVHIDELFVKRDFRSRGIASGYFSHLLKEYRGRAKALMLEVTPDNKRALALYTSLGFKRSRNTHLVRT